jgi:hypothetical protein
MAVFWVVVPCSLVEVYERFRGPCCLHHQGDHRYTAQQPRRQPSFYFCCSSVAIATVCHIEDVKKDEINNVYLGL